MPFADAWLAIDTIWSFVAPSGIWKASDWPLEACDPKNKKVMAVNSANDFIVDIPD